MANNIASPRGCREAPAQVLLAIAHGLATGDQWWLWSPADRKREGWVLPAPATLAEAVAANEAVERNPPLVRMDGPAFEWVPFSDGCFDDSASRRIVIRVEDGASVGTIEWTAGAHKDGEEFKCSSFLASILVILPDAEDDGTLARYIEAGDQEEARRLAAVRAAKAAGLDRVVINNSGYAVEVSRADTFRPGRQPRRSWNLEGEELRFAPFPRPHEVEALVASAEPLPWRASRQEVGEE